LTTGTSPGEMSRSQKQRRHGCARLELAQMSNAGVTRVLCTWVSETTLSVVSLSTPSIRSELGKPLQELLRVKHGLIATIKTLDYMRTSSQRRKKDAGANGNHRPPTYHNTVLKKAVIACVKVMFSLCWKMERRTLSPNLVATGPGPTLIIPKT